MADEKILVEIVLDDGSVQRGFAKIQQGANQTSKAVTKDFQTVGDALDSVSVSNFTNQLRNIPVAFGGIVVAATAVGAAFKEAFDLALVGEQLAAADAQFQRLTQNAGISAEALRTSFERSASGLVDIDDVVKVANEAIINLGSSAQRLPEILELSRRVTAALGGDITQRFEGIVRAIETGNQRALRQQGIIIDANKAFRDYAQTIGVAANELTLAQRQQALLNATIEQGGKQFANVSTSVQPLTDATRRLKVQIGELGDAAALTASAAFGGAFSRLLDSLTLGLQRLTAEITGVRSLELLRADLKRIGPELVELTNLSNQFGQNLDLSLQARLRVLQQQEQDILKAIAEQSKAARDAKTAALTDTGGTGGEGQVGITQEQLAAQQQRQAQINQLFQQGSQFRIQLLQLELQQTQDLEQQKILNQQITDEQIRIAAETLNNDLLAIEQKYSTDLAFTEEQRDQARLARAIAFNSQLQLINGQSAQRQLAQQVALSNQLRTITLTGLSQTLQGIGAALARGENLFAAFGQGLVGIFGDILITVGNALIIQGIALEKFITAINTLLPGSGLAAAAAGVGLVIFGSALKAAVGSRGTGLTATPTPVVPTSPIGETAPVPTSPTELTPVSETQRAVDTQVVVNIQGDVLDSDETGSRIISLINEAFDKKGVQVRRGVTA